MIELWKKNIAFALVAVVKTAGSTPGKTGFKIFIDKAGATFDTIGGGHVGRALLYILTNLKFSITLIDNRKELFTSFPTNTKYPFIKLR